MHWHLLFGNAHGLKASHEQMLQLISVLVLALVFVFLVPVNFAPSVGEEVEEAEARGEEIDFGREREPFLSEPFSKEFSRKKVWGGDEEEEQEEQEEEDDPLPGEFCLLFCLLVCLLVASFRF